MQCPCGREIIKDQYFAESAEAYAKRLASGRCRAKCVRQFPVLKEKAKFSLSLISSNIGPVQGVRQEKPHRWAHPPYRRFVSSFPCCYCAKMGAEPHHHQEPGEGCTGGKVGDEKCVPLCHVCHRDIHQYGRGVWDMWGVNPVEVIAYMQRAWWEKFGTRPWLNI